jgi:hypothetical protein
MILNSLVDFLAIRLAKGDLINLHPFGSLTFYNSLNQLRGSKNNRVMAEMKEQYLNESPLEPDSLTPPKNLTYASKHLRLVFLKYLQQQFPYGEDFVFDELEINVPHSQVYTAIKVYKTVSSRDNNYQSLALLWVSFESRQALYDKRSSSFAARRRFNELTRQWNAAADAILFMLLYPDLRPKQAITLWNLIKAPCYQT